jgi:Flp pilus assembly pilin Flp
MFAIRENKRMKKLRTLINDESGMETLEYAVIAGLIAAVAVAVYSSGGTWATTLVNRLLNATTTS